VVAVSLLAGCDAGLDNSGSEAVAVGARHVFPGQPLLQFYLVSVHAVFFNKEATDHNQAFLRAYWGLFKKIHKKFMAVDNSQ